MVSSFKVCYASENETSAQGSGQYFAHTGKFQAAYSFGSNDSKLLYIELSNSFLIRRKHTAKFFYKSVPSANLRLPLVTLTSTFIILDVTKTSSNSCLFLTSNSCLFLTW